MADLVEEIAPVAVVVDERDWESILDKISEKLHHNSSSSDSEDEDKDMEKEKEDKAAAAEEEKKAKAFRIFGREKPVDDLLGGGKHLDFLNSIPAVRASRSSRKLKVRPQMPVDSTETIVHYINLLFKSRTTTTTLHFQQKAIVARTLKGREPEAPVTPDKPRTIRSSMRVKQKIKKNVKKKTKKKIKCKTNEEIYKRPIPMVISWAHRAARSDCDRRPMKQSSDLLLSSPTNPQSPDGSTIIVLHKKMLEKLNIEQSGEEHQCLINSEFHLTAPSQAQGDGALTFEETSEKSKIEVSKLRPTEAYQDFIISKAYKNAKAQVVIHKGGGASIFEKTQEKSEIEASKALPTEEHQAIKELEALVTYEWVTVGALVYEETLESKIGYNESRSIEEQHAFKQTKTRVTQARVHDEYLITSAPSVEESPEKPNNMIHEPRLAKHHASMTPQARPEVFHEGTTNQVFEEMLEKCNAELNGLRDADEHEGARMYNSDGSSQNGVYKGDQVGGIYMTFRAQHDTLREGNTTSTIEELGQKSNIELSRLQATDEHQGVEVPGTSNYKSLHHGGYKSNEEGDKQGKQKNKRTLQKIKKKRIRPKIKDFMNGSQTPRQPKHKENKGLKRHYTRKNKIPNHDLKDAASFSPNVANEEFETLSQPKKKDNKDPKRRYTRKNKGWNPNSEDVAKVESDAINTLWKVVDRQSPTVKRSLNFDLEDRPVGVGTESNSTRPYTELTLDYNKLVLEDSDVRHSPSRRESIQKVRHKFRVKAFLRRLNLNLGGEAVHLVTKGNFTRPYTKLSSKTNKLAIKYSIGSRPSRRECLKKGLSLLALRNEIYQDLVDSSCRLYVTSNPSCVTLYKDFYGRFCVTLYKDFYGQFMKVDKNGRRKRKRIENLKECGSCELPACDGQILHAIVPYIKPIYDNMKYQNMVINDVFFSGGGMLVPFSSKKPRVKVNLDPETEREWQLLIGKKTKDESGVGDTKFWENERMLLHHRIHAFTAQMNLIQGDRRFSRWGGSVVDSVVGVFLTQNVSDHLSSSAFMAIAARFPALSKVKNAKYDYEKRSTSTEYVKESNFANNYTTKRQETIQVTNCDQGFAVTNKVENSAIKEMPGSFTCLGSTTKGDNVEVSEEHVGSILNHLHTSHHSHSLKAIVLGQTKEVTDTDKVYNPEKVLRKMSEKASTSKRSKKQTEESRDWDILRKDVLCGCSEGESNSEAPDIVDWEAVRSAGQEVLAKIIKDRGMQNQLGERILDFLNRTKNNHGSINLEWLRKVSPDKAKEYLLDIFGLGLKSTECIRLLSLEQKAFPVDTNVGRICVRLGWVPLMIDPGLPESTQIHLLEQYPLMDGIQKYLWTRLYTLDKSSLYELHYQMITFGKVFCTKVKPNCNACPMRGSCKHYASASSSARLLIQGLEKKNSGTSSVPEATSIDDSLALTIITSNDGSNPAPQSLFMSSETIHTQSEPIIEFPESPKHVCSERPEQGFIESLVDNEDAIFESSEDFGDTGDIEDYCDPNEIQFIDLTKNDTQKFWDGVKESGLEVNYDEFSKANYVPTITSKTRKPKETIDLRTQHEVYEIPDGDLLLEGMDPRVPNDPCPYLLFIWSPGETSQSNQTPEICSRARGTTSVCDEQTCRQCNTLPEHNAEIVKATFLIPCRTANRGAFPLNGTYFQTNEVFADDASSMNPIDVQMTVIQKFSRRTLYVGSSTYAIFRGMTSADEIGLCFQRGNICVRGFDRETRRPMRLTGRLHSKLHKGIKSKKPNNVRGGKGNQKT